MLACRSIDLGAAAVTKLKEEFKSREFRLVQLDLSEDESIEAFVQEVSHSFDKVDLLFHNAAIAPGFREAILLTMQTNYFGTVKLNRLMLPLLKKSAQPNVVVVSSLLLRNAYFGCSQSIQQRWRSADTEDKVTQIIEDYLDVVQSKRDPNHAWPSLSKNTVYSMSKLASKLSLPNPCLALKAKAFVISYSRFRHLGEETSNDHNKRCVSSE